MIVVSAFDGIGGARLALKRNNIEPDLYISLEVDKYALKVLNDNWSDIIHMGDITMFNNESILNLPVDLLIGGSPCQGFSFAGKLLNFNDPRSKLFFEFVRLKNELNPRYFLLENVKMKKEYQNVISEYLGVEPIEINSSLISAQHRVRLYWTNLPKIKIPIDKNIFLKDIIYHNTDYNKKYIQVGGMRTKRQQQNLKQPNQKANTFLAQSHKGSQANGMTIIYDDGILRRISPKEVERFQTYPDNYTRSVSDVQKYRLLGNSFTVDIITHLLSFME